jgi:hypothetical protein
MIRHPAEPSISVQSSWAGGRPTGNFGLRQRPVQQRKHQLTHLLLLPVLLLAMEHERASQYVRRSTSSDEASELATAA